ALFAVTTPFGTDVTVEARQGRALVDAAAAARVGHIVFTSAAHADRATGVPHYDSKYLVEQHLRASGVAWTVLGPAAFMDNFATGWTLDGLREGTFAWPMPADRPLTLIPVADIGAFAARALLHRAEFSGRRIDIASDTCTPAHLAAVLSAAARRPITHQEVPLDQVRRWSDDLAAMFAYFVSEGLDVGVADLRRAHPEVRWHTFAEWAAEQDWAASLAAAAV
ncbi:NmrA family NAD(P)-binding protein, partial [Streptomyces sp. SID5785]|uniref:NmrA family NAD(P)-binding protein n=1 Tax=Streptomyces sp. SID5785 TaxID=2690309 RepID=UPI0013612001